MAKIGDIVAASSIDDMRRACFVSFNAVHIESLRDKLSAKQEIMEIVPVFEMTIFMKNANDAEYNFYKEFIAFLDAKRLKQPHRYYINQKRWDKKLKEEKAVWAKKIQAT